MFRFPIGGISAYLCSPSALSVDSLFAIVLDSLCATVP